MTMKHRDPALRLHLFPRKQKHETHAEFCENSSTERIKFHVDVDVFKSRGLLGFIFCLSSCQTPSVMQRHCPALILCCFSSEQNVHAPSSSSSSDPKSCLLSDGVDLWLCLQMTSRQRAVTGRYIMEMSCVSSVKTNGVCVCINVCINVCDGGNERSGPRTARTSAAGWTVGSDGLELLVVFCQIPGKQTPAGGSEPKF